MITVTASSWLLPTAFPRFDVILKNKVTKKGTVLTQMSKFWFDYTRDLLPNHMLSVDVKDMPEFFQQPQFDGNSMMCRS